MQVWRVCRRPFADLSGEGARRFGGRWNAPGRPVIYATESAALAVLEVRVHLDLEWDVVPDDYVLVAIDVHTLIPETVAEMPPNPVGTGDAWLSSGRTALLRVPSVIVPESSNILINPRHPDAAVVSMAGSRSFAFDERLWLPRPQGSRGARR